MKHLIHHQSRYSPYIIIKSPSQIMLDSETIISLIESHLDWVSAIRSTFRHEPLRVQVSV